MDSGSRFASLEKTVHGYLTSYTFVQNAARCIYSRETDSKNVIIKVWVKDLFIAASKEQVLLDVKEMLSSQFQMKDLGEFKHFLRQTFLKRFCVIFKKMTQKRILRTFSRDRHAKL